jgi:hypothetical protein
LFRGWWACNGLLFANLWFFAFCFRRCIGCGLSPNESCLDHSFICGAAGCGRFFGTLCLTLAEVAKQKVNRKIREGTGNELKKTFHSIGEGVVSFFLQGVTVMSGERRAGTEAGRSGSRRGLGQESGGHGSGYRLWLLPNLGSCVWKPAKRNGFWSRNERTTVNYCPNGWVARHHGDMLGD